jgi:hypothetical protein
MTLTPVILQDNEIVPLPSGSRNAVLVVDGERQPSIGLRCAFCDHFYPEFSRSMLGVAQVQVSDDGEEAKRWGGGALVWRCNRCKALRRRVALDGRQLIKTRTPEATVVQIKQRIANSVFGIVSSQKW